MISKDLNIGLNDLLVTDSSNSEIFSRHVVSRNFYCKNAKVIKNYILHLIQRLKDQDNVMYKYIDTSVYDKNKQFRLLYSAKIESNRYK